MATVTRKLSMWGNSPALRLPKEMLDILGVGKDSLVNISIQNGSIVIQPKSLVDQLKEFDSDDFRYEDDSAWLGSSEMGREIE